MKTVLYPAIALMNRLNFGMKFSLISVLFFLPMAVTNYYLVSDSYDQYVRTSTELESLELLGSTLKIRRDLEEVNDLALISRMLGESSSAEADARIAKLEQSLIEQFAALQAVSHDAQQVEQFNAQRDELLNAMRAIKAQVAPVSKRAQGEELLAKVQLFIKGVASDSGLSQDDSRDVRQMVELVMNVTPQVTAVLATGRSVGAYSLGVGFLDSGASVKLEDALLLMEKLHAEYGLKIKETLAASPGAQRALGNRTAASQETLKELAKVFEDKVILAESLKGSWQEFFAEISGEMEKTYQVNDATLVFLQAELSERLQQKGSQTILLVVALLVVFLSIVYLYGGFYVSTRTTLKSLGLVMDKVAAGDMTVSYKVQSRDELGELGDVFNGTVVKIHDLIERVGHTVTEVERQADRVEVVSGESNQAVAGQRSQIEQVATAMNEMSATAQEVARSAAAAVGSAQSVNDETVSGRELVDSQVGSIQRLASGIDQSVAVINQLAADSASISRVLEVIKGIAEQTNLLALNAAIEAARAGEQGRGFAVVADEVRTLAKRTQQSTEEIEQMISKLQGGVAATVKAMSGSHKMADDTVSQSSKVQQALENILGAVGMIVDQNQQIAAAAEQQTAVAHDIDQNIVAINEAGERTAEGSSQTEQASRELSDHVSRLKQLISAFRVRGQA
ncbi:MAG: methyl-accepting chemotaxis protein [Pseudomonadaceae bacterium]|uniref:methyl-accepting chemotaxis protein n=2 Tax=Pseudomonas sp. TaxID=306 RepID=UPI002C87679A|nr:methyl-accepting chemotaxis protein [Pseudomonas sp.]MBX9713030.1 methyl-accepting chemotaxis protein [Pseudomonadaceae bacterium]HRL93661.1 methyl-accepting chemotaxis protein [Pseudomonas sp.]